MTMNASTKKHEIQRKGRVQSTIFADGMVVDASDLAVASEYPVKLFQTFFQAYFGCGVACGLRVTAQTNQDGNSSFCVKIDPGMALDCAGYPIELCQAETIVLTPDPCDPCDPLSFANLPQTVAIGIRRITCPESPRNDGSQCDNYGKPACRYTREREGTLIKVFTDDCTPTFCERPENTYAQGAIDPCSCLWECADCACCECCDESWVLLAYVEIKTTGVTVDTTRRRYIKPIECHCPPWKETVQFQQSAIVAEDPGSVLTLLQQRSDTLQQRIGTLNTGLVAIDEEIETEMQNLERIEARLDASIEAGDVDAERDSRRELAVATRRLGRLQSRVTALADQAQHIEGNHDDIHQSFDRLQVQIAEQKVQSFEAELVNARRRYEESEADAEEAQRRIGIARQVLRETKRKAKSAKTKAEKTTVDRNLKAAQAEVDESNERLKERREIVKQAKSAISDIESAIAKAQIEVKSIRESSGD